MKETNGKLIVKNSFYMGLRMILSMSVNLYANRVILNQLGVTEFGIYNVVAGLTVMMSFFSNALITAVQRCYNVELGVNGKSGLQTVFSASNICVVIVAVSFVAIALPVGMWMLAHVLSIPDGYGDVARYAFWLSIVVVVVEITRIPFNSLIISCERMSFYAWNSILESLLKLLIVFLLSCASGSKLMVYMWLLVGVAMIVNVSYVWYVKRTLPSIKLSFVRGIGKVKEIARFVGWNVLTAIANVAHLQGSVMILNVFFGVTLNATMGIANQVKTAVTSIARSVQVASNPQLVQHCASNRKDAFEKLLARATFFAMFFVLLIGIPIVENTWSVLELWLRIVPPNSVMFVRLMILFCFFYAVFEPLKDAIQATGHIACYQTIESVVWVLSLPIIYVGYHEGFPSWWMMVVLDGLAALIFGVRLWFARRLCGVNVWRYFKNVYVKGFMALAPAWGIMWGVGLFIDNGLIKLLVTTVLWGILFPMLCFIFVLSRSERAQVSAKVKRMLGVRQ